MPDLPPSPAVPTAPSAWGRLRAWALTLLGGLILLLPVPARASAAAVAFRWAQAQVTTGLNSPNGMAMDGSGNVYVADTNNSRVLKLTPNGDGTFAQMVVYSATPPAPAAVPDGVAVDSSGNVYIADYANGKVVKAAFNAAATPQYTPQDLFTNVSQVRGVAVDSQGNLYYAGGLSGNVYVKKATPAAGGYAVTDAIQSGTPASAPAGLAVDANDTLYVADTLGGRVLAVDGNGASAPLAASFTFPLSVAVSPNAVYIADSGQILKYQDGALAAHPVAQGLTGANGLTVDNVDHLYFTGATTVNRMLPASDFGRAPVNGAGGYPITLGFVFTTGTSGTPLTHGANVVAQGAATTEFQIDPDSTAIANAAFATDEVALVNVSFHPARPGIRSGAVVVSDNSGNPLATAYLQGMGSGPQVLFPRAITPTEPITGLNGPNGVAVGADGSVYVADWNDTVSPGTGRVLMATPGNNGYNAPVTVAGNLAAEPCGVAVDGAGNVYWTDKAGDLYLATRTLTGFNAPGPALLTGLTSTGLPPALAVDGGGHVYVTYPDASPVAARMFDFSTTPFRSVDLLGNPMQLGMPATIPTPTSLALSIDGSGDVWVGDLNGGLWRVQDQGVTATSVGNAGSSMSINGMALDAAGGWYVVLPTMAWAYGWGGTKMVDLTSGAGVALDAAGNAYITDHGAKQLLRLDAVSAPTLAFGDVQVGTSGTQSLYVLNNGNGDLTFPAPTTSGSTNPTPDPAGYGVGAASGFPIAAGGQAITLHAGGTARVDVTCAPLAIGADNGTLTLTDDHLGNTSPYATQSVPMTATATVGAAVITLAGSQSKPYTGQGVAADFQVVPQAPTTVTYVGTDVTYGPTSAPPTALGSYGVTVAVTDPNYLPQARNGTLIITRGLVQQLTLDPAALQNQVYTTQPHPVGCTSVPTGVAATATVTYSGTTSAGAVYPSSANPPVEAGTYTVTATTTDPNYQVTTVSQPMIIAPATATITLDTASLTQAATGSPLQVRYSVLPATAPVTGTYTGVSLTYGPSATAPDQAGTYAFVAHIVGPNYTGTDVAGVFTITGPTGVALGTRTGVVANPNPIQPFQQVTLVAGVAGGGQAAPTGTVTFSDGGVLLGAPVALVASPDLPQAAKAQMTLTSLGAGTHSITAAYSGDTLNAPSTGTLQLEVQAAPPLAITAPGGQDDQGGRLTVTLGQGGTGTTTFNIQAPSSAFTTLVTFGTTGLPSGATATFDPAIVTPATLPTQIKLYLRMVPAAVRLRQQDRPVSLPIPGGGAAGAFLACGLLALPWAGRHRRRSRLWTGLALLLAVGLMGCWSRNPRTTVYHATVTANLANAPAGTPPVATFPVDVVVPAE